jgi:hypothetical protein
MRLGELDASRQAVMLKIEAWSFCGLTRFMPEAAERRQNRADDLIPSKWIGPFQGTSAASAELVAPTARETPNDVSYHLCALCTHHHIASVSNHGINRSPVHAQACFCLCAQQANDLTRHRYACECLRFETARFVHTPPKCCACCEFPCIRSQGDSSTTTS